MIEMTAMKRPGRGFSLLELLVVLVILGGITGLAMPNLVRLYESVTTAVERDSILDQLSNMGRIALLNQQAYLLDDSRFSSDSDQEDNITADYPPYALELPPGWDIELEKPIIVRANGVCMGGTVSLLYDGEQRFETELQPPYCHVTK
jgi:general secretion pathway protein G